MTFIAVFFILALVGLVVTIGFIIAGALYFKNLTKRLMTMIAPTKDCAIELVNTSKGIGEKGKARYHGYAKHGSRIVNTVRSTADDVGKAAKSMDVDGARNKMRSAAETVRAAQNGISAAKVVLDILNKAQRSK
jgi:hypothetical protein